MRNNSIKNYILFLLTIAGIAFLLVFSAANTAVPPVFTISAPAPTNDAKDFISPEALPQTPEAVSYATADADYKYEETKNLVSLVKDAVALIQEQGENAFEEFNKPDCQWCHDETYLVVFDMDLTRIVYAPHQEKVGENIKDLKDMVGKPIGKMILEIANSRSRSGWVNYLWRKPDQWRPTWLSTFIMTATAPSGKRYIVGSGIYNMKTEPVFIIDMVNEAASLIEKNGEDAFESLRDIAGKFVYSNIYVFVDTEDGTEVVNPAFPDIEGKNILNLQDINGKFVVRDYINLALTKGNGWISYMWPKPKTITPWKKLTYVKRVAYGKKVYIVGCGIYDN